VAQNITSLVWKSNATLSESDLDGFTNPNMLIFVDSKDKTTLTRNNVVIAGTAARVVLSDVTEGNGNFHCPQEFMADSIIYRHSYKQATEIGVARGWETLALPFDVQTITHEKNGVIAPFGNDSISKHFWLRTLTDRGLESATHIYANNGYLISMPNNAAYPATYNQAGWVTFSSANVKVPVTSPNSVVYSAQNSAIVFIPTFQRMAANQQYYMLNVGEERSGHAEGSVFEANYRDALPFQVVTFHEGGQRPAPRYISLQDMSRGTTGIETIELPQWSGENWWTQDGRKLNGKPSQKGIYIRNGKKVVVNATF
jgi:hypothetical protein